MSGIKKTMLFKILALILTVIEAMGIIAPPSADDPIKALDEANLRLSFAAWADPQIAAHLVREPYLKNAATDLSSAMTSPDALVIAGDITENGLDAEYGLVYDDLSICNNINNYLIATGNHDIRLRSYEKTKQRFTQLYNEFTGSSITSLNYSVVINGYYFIVLASDKNSFEKAVISDEQLLWLDETLAEGTKSGLPAFVICHQPLKNTHGLPGVWNNGGLWESGDLGEQSDEVLAILQKYNNIFFISGHLHTGIGEYTYEEIGGVHSVNLPSLSIKCGDGDYNERGAGYMFEVYDDCVKLRARDFNKGVYLPEYDIEIELN